MSQTKQTKAERREQAREERLAAERAAALAAARSRRLKQLGVVLAMAAAIVVGLIVISSSGTDDGPQKAAGEQVAGQTEVGERFAGIPQDGIALGKPDAPVTLVEFADMQCPFCADFATDGLPTLVEEEVKSGKLRVEFRTMAFIGEDSTKLARVVHGAAAQDKAWQVIDLLFINQGQENSGFATDGFVRDTLSAVEGLDVDKVLTDAEAGGATTAIDEVRSLSERYAIQSTPSFLIGKTGGSLEKLDVQNLDGTQIRDAVKELAG